MWLSYAFFSALFLGVRRIYEKKLSADFGNFSLSFVTLAFSLPFTFALFFFLPIPHDLSHLPMSFWWPLLVIWFVLYPVQNYFLYRSIREGELSEVTPVGSLLPVFNIVTSLFILHEIPSVIGFVGIVITVIATYVLLTDVDGFHGQRFNRPVLFMICTVACTAVGSTLDKVAVEASTPVFYSFVNVFGAAVVFLVLSFWYGEHRDLKRIGSDLNTLLVLGVVMTLGFTAAMFAFASGPTSYVLAIRSAGFLLAAMWGIVMLGERMSLRKAIALVLFAIGTIALATG